MIKILYIFKKESPIEHFVERQIKEANLEGYEIERIQLDEKVVEKYQIKKWNTFIFTDKKGNELVRFDGICDASTLESLLYEAKGILSNRLKVGGLL